MGSVRFLYFRERERERERERIVEANFKMFNEKARISKHYEYISPQLIYPKKYFQAVITI